MKSYGYRLIFALALFFPFLAHAIGEPYTREKLDALNQEGKPALVFIYANWCPTCKAQEKVLEKLLPTEEFKSITTLKIDFDAQRAEVKSFGVRYQSTLILFKEGKEVSRITAETDGERIADLLRTAH